MIGIMAALLIYQVVSIHSVQATVTKLSTLDFRAGGLAVQLMRDRDLVEEYARKYFVGGDPDYVARLQELLGSFDGTLTELRSTTQSTRVREEIERVTTLWKEFSRILSGYQREPVQQWAGALPEELEARLEKLRAQALLVHEAALGEIESEGKAARRTGRQAEVISWYTAALALLLCSVISLLIVRSISTRLRELTAGTRVVAEGRFVHQLEASGRDEFSQLARDFNTMTRRLGELDTLKKDFVSHVSHELKSPLASIQETIRLLLDQLPGPLTEKQKRLLELNLKSAGRLSAMIGNLLDLSRMEAGALQYDIKTHDLRELVRVGVAESELQAAEKRLDIALELPESPLSIECDCDRIIQVVENLLGNAIKFSPGPGTIDVAAGVSVGLPEGLAGRWPPRPWTIAPDETCLMITVADHGPGVPDAQKEMIFEKFRQTGHGKKMAGQGVGLGLAITRTIVEAHSGAIWVEDNPGGGSQFIILLPARAKRENGPLSSKPI